jgi:pimeloyl-ACP methyl ester carboxylesterase
LERGFAFEGGVVEIGLAIVRSDCRQTHDFRKRCLVLNRRTCYGDSATVYLFARHEVRMRPMLSRAARIAAVLCSLLVVSAQSAAASSSGYNDFGCRPSAAHPDPVVLIHGFGGTAEEGFGYLAPYLARAGYCVFASTYGKASPSSPFGGTIAVADSANQIGAFIDQVRTATGAARVDIVGHSEGGFQSLYVPKVLGYSPKVARVVALAPPSHGTSFGGLVDIAYLLNSRQQVAQLLRAFGCPACDDLITGGGAVKQLTNGPIAQAGVAYTIIASRTDLLVTPHETSFVREPGVDNAFVQDTCPLDPVGHIGLALDSGVAQMITNALDPAHAVRVACTFGPPV